MESSTETIPKFVTLWFESRLPGNRLQKTYVTRITPQMHWHVTLEGEKVILKIYDVDPSKFDFFLETFGGTVDKRTEDGIWKIESSPFLDLVLGLVIEAATKNNDERMMMPASSCLVTKIDKATTRLKIDRDVELMLTRSCSTLVLEFERDAEMTLCGNAHEDVRIVVDGGVEYPRVTFDVGRNSESMPISAARGATFAIHTDDSVRIRLKVVEEDEMEEEEEEEEEDEMDDEVEEERFLVAANDVKATRELTEVVNPLEEE